MPVEEIAKKSQDFQHAECGFNERSLTNEFPMPANEAVKHYAFDRRGQRFAQWLPT